MSDTASKPAGTPEPALDPSRLVGLVQSSTEYSLVMVDTEGRITVWNEGARRNYGWEAEEILGKGLAVLQPTHPPPKVANEEMLATARTAGKYEGVVDRLRNNGTQFRARVTVTPFEEAGEIAGFLVISKDVGGELLREAAQRDAAEERFRGLLEAAPDAIVIVNAGGWIVLANSQAERLFGYPREEMIGERVEKLVPPRFRANHPARRSGFVGDPRVRPMGAGLDLYGLRKDGTEFPVEISLSPLDTAEGMLVSSAIRDATERRDFERRLRDTNAQLQAALEAKDRFLASMSHELRTPLNAILGFTGTMLMELPGPLVPDQREQLETVQANAEHLLSLINDMLDLARIESGKVELYLEPLDVGALMREVLASLEPLAREKDIDLVADVPADLVSVEADRRALNQILLNLIGNGVKFTEVGSVTVSVTQTLDPVRTSIAVTDTGVGIAPADQERLFQAFEQLGASATRRHEGSGLGLFICQRLAELLGGRISCVSTLGEGTTFTLELTG